MYGISAFKPANASGFFGKNANIQDLNDALRVLHREMEEAGNLRNETSQQMDMYGSPEDGSESIYMKMQKFPGKESEKSVYEAMGDVQDSLKRRRIPQKDAYREIYKVIPLFFLTGGGLDLGVTAMFESLLARFIAMDQYEALLKRDPDALKKGYLASRTTYDAEELARVVPDKYTKILRNVKVRDSETSPWRSKYPGVTIMPKPNEPDTTDKNSTEYKQYEKEMETYENGIRALKDYLNDLPNNADNPLLDDPSLREAGTRDPREFKILATLNAGRWQFPYVISPALGPGIDQMVQSTLDMNWADQPSYLPDDYQGPSPWQDPDLPEHPWQKFQPYPNPWMDNNTVQKAFLAKSPFEIRSENKQKWHKPDIHTENHELEWDDFSEMTLWEPQEYLEGMPGF